MEILNWLFANIPRRFWSSRVTWDTRCWDGPSNRAAGLRMRIAPTDKRNGFRPIWRTHAPRLLIYWRIRNSFQADSTTGILSAAFPQDTFLSTRAEFFDPKAMQLHTACSICFFLPASGT